MGVHIRDNRLKTLAEWKTVYFDLPKNVGNNLKDGIDFIKKKQWTLSRV